MSVEHSLGDRAAKIARYFLAGCIAVLLALIVAGPKNGGVPNPLSMSPAHANSLAAAPGYLLLTLKVGPASTLYVTDTNKQVICGYTVTGDKLRLTSARKFDFDGDIFAGDLRAGRFNTGIEGGNGIARKDAEEYSILIKKELENAMKAKKP